MISLWTALFLDMLAAGAVSWLARRRGASPDVADALVLVNLVTFALCWTLRQAPLDLGLGLGLFAIFGVLRYRAETLTIRDLTAMFVALGLAVLHGLRADAPLGELVALDAALTLASALLGGAPPAPVHVRHVVYDRPELAAAVRREELFADLRARIGEDPLDVRVGRTDLLKDTVDLNVVLAGSPR